jgi:hypothetical protein
MTVPERFRSYVTYLRHSTGIRIININDKITSINAIECHETIESAHKTIENAHNNSQEYSGTLNGQERLGTFESERSNAMERIVENGHGTFTFTLQKRKNYCNIVKKISQNMSLLVSKIAINNKRALIRLVNESSSIL